MSLTANREVDHYVDLVLRLFQAADEHIYKGAFISFETTGYAAPLTAGELFAGIAYEECDNSAGFNGDKSVRCYTQGDFKLSLSGATLADIGKAVYASDDATLTLTSTDNTFIGHVIDVPSSGTIILRIQPFTTVP